MTESNAKHLQHVVLFKFPDPLTASEEAEMFAIVESWEHEIGTLIECRIGSDLTGARAEGYQYLLYTVLGDAEALKAYIAHPTHQLLVAFLDSRSCERLAFDYYI